MKYIFQFCIIMIFVIFGEVLAAIIPLPIAGGIYGLVALFLCLCTGVIKLAWVDDVATWLHSIMSLFFIAPAAAIIDTWSDIAPVWWILLLLLVAAYLITMASTGLTAQLMIGRNNKTKQKSNKTKTTKGKK